MTGAAFAEQLAHAGIDRSAVPMATACFDTALAGFRAICGGRPHYAWWVPGRLEVFGKHTDYGGGRTLVAALPRGFAFLGSPRRDEAVHLLDAASGDRVVFEPGQGSSASWHRYADAVIRRLARDFPGARPGADIAFAGNLPPAAGMSSSSALVVGLATALIRVWGLEDRPAWQTNVPDSTARAAYLASLESGAPFGTLAGDTGVGTHGGSEDHAAMLLGTAGAVSAFSFVPLQHLGDTPVPDEWRIVAAASGVAAEKTGGVRDAYNRLSEGAAVLLRLWNDDHTPARSLAAALGSREHARNQLREIIQCSNVAGWPPDALERRLEHFSQENGRVLEAARALREHDREALSALSIGSQQDAEQLLGNQIPQTIALVESARRRGAFAACSFGAGFGGGAWALVDRDRAEAFTPAWTEEFGGRYRAEGGSAFIATPGPPVTELSI